MNFKLFIIGGALLLFPISPRAQPYDLFFCVGHNNQIHGKGSKAPKRPLVVDLVGHTLTLPEQVTGYTLELKNEEGETYTYYIIDTVFKIPQELDGIVDLTISNGDIKYQGTIEVQS